MAKNWLITGASSGLGRGLAERLLARGDGVVATLRKPGALDDLRARHGDLLQVVECDVTDVDAIRAAVAHAFAAKTRIDVVVSNAGYGLFGAAEELSDAQIDRQIATNLTGSIQLIRAVVPRLRGQGGGRIVQVSSEGGRIGYPGFSAYHATKWGIEGFVEAVAKEVGPFGIDFVIVEPGPTRTNFGAGLDRATPMSVYDATPAGEIRRLLDAGYFEFADAGKTVDAMIETIDSPSPPFRLALGKSTYESVRAALVTQLEILDAQKAIALSVMEGA
ncbi:SDR family oxidoreductase [Paraburkholderia caballeronis]|uniref:Short-chain dehydrogenase n=1 Tax=Paraburkholderia caballeronis TaxID=416943 RepID=A0A1H7G6A8_9BURK|nr:SDR family oxidoreductase [Paraburkholderia caballeronis]PXW24690.1 short-subunit dehydrogenase [Paraburkholderia caballeronis]PXX00420.1 short-subunit dehydrogenase [Paraburkholderia caballeronis]RAJ98483.1 short-subunit dehydrogenase [Paraburkholderia caballeronis]SEE64846.1 Short-chain dehydrogenase [Paraburkholderia caballeronis]SEK33668.1 Short-chain dehydrogenase [Paraburkholderia caballeronis]